MNCASKAHGKSGKFAEPCPAERETGGELEGGDEFTPVSRNCNCCMVLRIGGAEFLHCSITDSI